MPELRECPLLDLPHALGAHAGTLAEVDESLRLAVEAEARAHDLVLALRQAREERPQLLAGTASMTSS